MVRQSDMIRLENVKTGQNLHSHGRYKSPVTKQGEVTMDGKNGRSNSDDNWVVKAVWHGSRGVLNNGSVFRLKHKNTKQFLHSRNSIFKLDGKSVNEITTFSKRDANDEFIIEFVGHPGQHVLTKNVWTQARGSQLRYNTLLWIDPVDTADIRPMYVVSICIVVIWGI